MSDSADEHISQNPFLLSLQHCMTGHECLSTLEKDLRKRGFIGRKYSAELAFCINVGYITVFNLQGKNSSVGDFSPIRNLYVTEHFSSSLFSPLSVPVLALTCRSSVPAAVCSLARLHSLVLSVMSKDTD